MYTNLLVESTCELTLFQKKDLLEIFLFLSNTCRKMGDTRTGNEIVNPCIDTISQ